MKSKIQSIIILLIILINLSCKNEDNSNLQEQGDISEKKETCQVNEQNRNSKLYDIDEASCFIALNLKGEKLNLASIKKALLLEENYMLEIGLISDNANTKNEQPMAVLEISKLIQYAMDDKSNTLTENQLLSIYDSETEYLTFLGLIE